MNMQAPLYSSGALFLSTKIDYMVVPFIGLILILVLITWFIVTAIKKKKRGEDLGETEGAD